MKILVDTSVLLQLQETYKDKAPKILFEALLQSSNELLGYEDIIRHHKIGQRVGVAQNENARDILSYMNKVTGKNFKPVEANLKLIIALLKDYTRKDLEAVIDNKTSKWKGTDMEDYLRPSTLFQKGKFDGYLNEAPSAQVVEKNLASELDCLLGSEL